MKYNKLSGRMEGRLGRKEDGRLDKGEEKRPGRSELSIVSSPLKRGRDRKFDLREKLRKNAGTLDKDKSQVTVSQPLKELEMDPTTLERRQRDITYGKNTQDYSAYRDLVEKEKRSSDMPRTPDKYKKFSRRRWDGLVKTWKLNIHRLVESLVVKEEGEEGDDEGELGVKKEEDIMEADSKQDVKDNWSMRPPLTSNSSWIDEIEEEEQMRSRLSSCESSDQGFSCHTSRSVTPTIVESKFNAKPGKIGNMDDMLDDEGRQIDWIE